MTEPNSKLKTCPAGVLFEQNSKLVLVFGATGYTGRQIVRELQRLGQPVAIAGRDRGKLEALRTELNLPADIPLTVADPTQPATLPALFGPEVGVIISCVGPFSRFGEPVVKAAVAAGVHYLDITGEQAYLARILVNYDTTARQKGCAIIPACGIEYTMTNWAAALAAEGLEPLDDLWTATAASQIRASQGTQLSLFEALARPGLGWENGTRRIRFTGSAGRRVNFPPPFGSRQTVLAPFGEVVTIPRHIQVQNMSSYLALSAPLAFGLRVMSPILPPISQLMGKVLEPLAKGPAANQPEASRWVVVAEGQSGKGRRRVAIQGRNVYELTANITSWCAIQLLQPGFKQSGTLGPAQAFDPQTALDYLKPFGVSYTIEQNQP